MANFWKTLSFILVCTNFLTIWWLISPNTHLLRIANDQIESKKNILIFGETGVGKTAVLNMLTDGAVLNNDWKDLRQPLSFEITTKEDINYYDTNGISEKKLNFLDALSYIGSLQELILLVSNKGQGINLLVLVMKRGRITDKMEHNYRLFVNLLTQNRVPVLLVITHVEEDSPVECWWDNNKELFDKYKFTFKETISVCGNRGEDLHKIFAKKLEDCYLTSQENLLQAVEKNILGVSWKANEIGEITATAIDYILTAGEMSTIKKYGLFLIMTLTDIQTFLENSYSSLVENYRYK